jgi:hypothetical protein
MCSGRRFLFFKSSGAKLKENRVHFELSGWWVDFGKAEGLLCKSCRACAVACVSADAVADVSGHMACCGSLGPPLCAWTGSGAGVDRVHGSTVDRL